MNERGHSDTISGLLARGRELSGGGFALQFKGGNSLTHGQLNELVLNAEKNLRELGIGRETRVMTALPDSTLTACVLLALTHSAICAPVNPDLRAAELETLIPELGVSVLVAHGPCAAEARRTAEQLGLPVIEVDWDGQAALKWTGPPLPCAPAPSSSAHPDDTALVLLTSGSSARPKRVPLTHRQLTLSARRMADSIALTPADCCLNMMPMFHVGAVVDLLLAPLAAGGSLVRPETMSVQAFFETVAECHPSWFQGVPTLLHELAAYVVKGGVPNPVYSLRLVRSVSSPLPPEWLIEIEAALRAPVIEIYGMTETAGVITSNPLPPAVHKHGSAGKATSMEIIICDASGAEAMTGSRGEILVRGSGVMSGYENLQGENFGLAADGWLPTGDEGFFDEDGYLFITGRMGERINRGGEKIAPREIDEVLASHPAVQEVAAFPLPHPQLGQEVAAAIVLKPAADISVECLSRHVSQKLAYFKVPKAFYVVPELPRGPGGKLRRRLLPDLVRELSPLADLPTGSSESPQTEMEKRVAAWWEKELGVSTIDRQGHFFDLGGDSLAAASFTVGIEKSLGLEIRPAALFDHPTVAEFAAYLEEVTTRLGGVTKSGLPPKEGAILAPEFHRRLMAAMSVWPGERKDEHSLLTGLRTDAPGIPLFWCGQGRHEFDNMVAQWPSDQPIYGTRSLWLFEGKTKQDEEALAMVLAREIDALRACREIIIAGFCAGGRIAFNAACHLRAMGVPVKMVFLHDVWMNKPIDVPVAMGFTENYQFSPYRHFNRPEVVLNKRFPGGWKIWQLPVDHNDIYAGDSLASEIQKLRTLWENPALFHRGSGEMEEVRPISYRARLSSWLYPRLIPAGATGIARITISNDSRHAWKPAEISGLHLGHRWRDREGKICGDPGNAVPLPRAVPPGGSITLTVRVKAPDHACGRWLEFDMVDEGVAWFSEKKSKKPTKSLRLKVRVIDRHSLGLFGKRPATPIS